jgi:hypothetical protein
MVRTTLGFFSGSTTTPIEFVTTHFVRVGLCSGGKRNYSYDFHAPQELL